MAKTKKYDSIDALALDEKGTVCREQLFNVAYDNNNDHFIFDYYVIAPPSLTKNNSVIDAIKNNAPQRDIKNSIRNYNTSYLKRQNMGFHNIERSDAIHLKTKITKDLEILSCDICFKKKALFNFETEKTLRKENIFQKDLLEDLKALSDIFLLKYPLIGKNNTSPLIQSMSYIASMSLGFYGKKHNLPLLYRDHGLKTKDEKEYPTLKRLATSPQNSSLTNRPHASAFAPLRSAEKMLNLTQLYRHIYGQPLLEKDKLNTVANIINQQISTPYKYQHTTPSFSQNKIDLRTKPKTSGRQSFNNLSNEEILALAENETDKNQLISCCKMEIINRLTTNTLNKKEKEKAAKILDLSEEEKMAMYLSDYLSIDEPDAHHRYASISLLANTLIAFNKKDICQQQKQTIIIKLDNIHDASSPAITIAIKPTTH